MKTRTTETEEVLDNLPRKSYLDSLRTPPNAHVSIDASGRLCILVNNGTLLTIGEKDFSVICGEMNPLTN